MSDTPRTVWGYCLEHDSLSVATLAVGDMCQVRDSYSFNDWVSWSAVKACRMVELRVAGPDDLVIRREKIDYEAAAELVAFRIGSVLQDGHEKEGACVMCRKDARDIIDAALVGKREAKENLRAAVVPLLRLEAAQRLLEDEYRRYRLAGILCPLTTSPDRWSMRLWV